MLTIRQQHLVRKHLLLVPHLVRKLEVQYPILRKTGWEECVAAGNLGLVKAARTFDHERGASFMSYAYQGVTYALLEVVRRESINVKLAWRSLDHVMRDHDINELTDHRQTASPMLRIEHEQLLSLLDARARALLEAYLDGQSTFKQLGRRHGLSGEGARLIVKKSIDRLRSHILAREAAS